MKLFFKKHLTAPFSRLLQRRGLKTRRVPGHESRRYVMSLRSSLMRGSIFDELAAMQREMNRIVRAAEQGAPLPFKAFSEVYPPINISETAEGYELECELPGYSMDDIELTVQGDTLTIKGKKEVYMRF